jgi:hypothetical protein
MALLAGTLPATVAAAQPVRASDSQTGMLCELTSEVGFVSVFVDIRDSGAFADVAIWAPEADPFSDPPTIVTAQATASLDGSSLTASFDLVAFAEPINSAGSVRLAAELTPFGPEQDFGSGITRDGNRLMRSEQTLQLLAANGSLTIDLLDGTQDEVDLGLCGASTFSSSFFGTNPNAYLTTTDQVFISCQWMTEMGAIDLLAISDEFGTFSQLIIAEGDRILVGLTVPVLSDTTYQALYELFDPSGSAETVGTATADAILSPSGDRITDHEWIDPYRFSVVGEQLAAEGTLALSVDGRSEVLPMDDTTCDAGDVRVQVMEKIGRG